MTCAFTFWMKPLKSRKNIQTMYPSEVHIVGVLQIKREHVSTYDLKSKTGLKKTRPDRPTMRPLLYLYGLSLYGLSWYGHSLYGLSWYGLSLYGSTLISLKMSSLI